MAEPDDFLRRRAVVSHLSERVPVSHITVPSNNWAAWSLALLPVGVVVLSFGIGVLHGMVTWAVIRSVSALLLVLGIVFARADRRILDSWGFENIPSGWWAALTPPVYLALRGNRVWRRTGGGFGPLWVGIAALVMAPVGVVALGVVATVGVELQRVYDILGM